jgi:para-aminobenzoate synthetase component 1
MLDNLHIPDIQLSDILLRLNESERHVCVLKSRTDNGWGTRLAWNPVETFKASRRDPHETSQELEKFTAEQQAKGRLIIGYLSYDFGCALHKVELLAKDEFTTPPVFAVSFDNWLSFDAIGATIAADQAWFISEVQQILKRPMKFSEKSLYSQGLHPVQSREWYEDAYQKIKAYLRAGDIYQVNLAQWLEGTTELSGRELFCRLSQSSKSDFQAYIEDESFEVLSYSPERFIQTDGNVITTMPIKGTRPRGKTDSEDEALRIALLESPKERAELDMITDLSRNDLGQICKPGSVRVSEDRTITGYPTLWHAHATVRGQLKNEVGPLGALISMLPGGSITGCPKKRAIEIIDELEPRRRGIYTGSVFTISPSGELDSSIVIRTLIKKDNHLYLPVGGGIVYDSIGKDEYQESLDKAASFLTH